MSSHASTQDKSPDPGQALTIERKKTKVLKQALKQERKERDTIQQEFEKSKEQIVSLNNQLQDKEKRFFELYQEKMMLEETLIRESATNKLQNRQSRASINIKTNVGPPVTFANPVAKDKEPCSPAEESKDVSVDGLNDTNFDIVPSPSHRRNTLYAPASQKAMVPQEQYDALKTRFIENETATQRRLESINDLESKIARREQQIIQMEKMFKEKLDEAKTELESYKASARENEKNIQNEVRLAKEEKVRIVAERDQTIESANEELTSLRETRDNLVQEKNKLEAFQDSQSNEIERLELDVSRAKEDVECRKLIIDEMSKSMLHHEKESMEMAQKLTLMKNQIMENDAEGGMMHRYAAVRLGTIRHHPCTVEFVKGEEDEYFMVVDGRHETITINFGNIDQFTEIEDSGRLSLVYHIPAEPTRFNPNVEGMVKKKDEFECAENDLILKTFVGIRNKLMGTAGDQQFLGHQFGKSLSQTPTMQRRTGPLV